MKIALPSVPILKNTNKSNLVMILCTLIFSLSLFVSCYLIALSNRCQQIGETVYFFDSWKKEVFFVGEFKKQGNDK